MSVTMQSSWCLVLALYAFSFIYIEVHSHRCVDGLMSAERVRQLSRVAGTLRNDHNEQQQITPEIKFSCSATVTKWIVAARYNGGTNFPEIQIWRATTNNRVYTKIHGTTLSFTSFKKSNIYECSTAPLEVQSGDVLGIFEPANSLLQVFYNEKYGPRNYYASTPGEVAPSGSTFDVDGPGARLHNDTPLITVEITPMDGSLAPDCISSFASMEAITLGLKQFGQVSERAVFETDMNQRVIPELRFTCHGFITKWIIGGRWGGDTNALELQTWNSSNGDTYVKRGATTVSNLPIHALKNYYEYSPIPPHKFSNGDVIGIFVPANPLLKMLIQSSDGGPKNYVYNAGGNTSPSGDDFVLSQHGSNPLPMNALPLMAVEVLILQSPTHHDDMAPSTINQEQSDIPHTSSLPPPNTRPQQIVDPQRTSTTALDLGTLPSESNNSSVSINSGSSGGHVTAGTSAGIAVGAVAAVAVLTIIGVIAGIVLRKRRRRGSKRIVRVAVNQAYEKHAIDVDFPNLSKNLAYGVNDLPRKQDQTNIRKSSSIRRARGHLSIPVRNSQQSAEEGYYDDIIIQQDVERSRHSCQLEANQVHGAGVSKVQISNAEQSIAYDTTGQGSKDGQPAALNQSVSPRDRALPPLPIASCCSREGCAGEHEYDDIMETARNRAEPIKPTHRDRHTMQLHG